jgi:2-polyprenyl-3-methyl-5-hydroxy-6-metoxy-1,4-benzoquinol methylase
MATMTTTARREQALDLLQRMRSDVETVEPAFRGWWSGYLESHTTHFLNVLELLPEPPARVLDVGNFPGHITVMLKELGYDVAGLDLSPERAGEFWRRHGIDQRGADVEQDAFPFDGESFDVVVLAEVFEHLRVNPFHALDECRRMLRPGGELLISVPNVGPHHRVQFLLGKDYQGDIIREFEKLKTRGHMGHIRLYSKGEMLRILEFAGFSVQTSRLAGDFPTGRWAWTRRLGSRGDVFRSHLYIRATRTS